MWAPRLSDKFDLSLFPTEARAALVVDSWWPGETLGETPGSLLGWLPVRLLGLLWACSGAALGLLRCCSGAALGSYFHFFLLLMCCLIDCRSGVPQNTCRALTCTVFGYSYLESKNNLDENENLSRHCLAGASLFQKKCGAQAHF